MLKFPPELIVHKGNVFSLLYVVGGLLMTVTAGSRCVDVAVWTAQDPANLLRLSKMLIGLMGLRYQADSRAKRKLKRLYFTESFLDITRTTLQGTHHIKVLLQGLSSERETNPESDSARCIAARRRRIYYILVCGVRGRPILTLCLGNDGSKLKTHDPRSQLEWLINFTGKAQARGDVIFLLLGEETGQTSAGSDTNEPTSLTLGFSALSVVFLWMFLPYIAVCVVLCLGWKVQQDIRRTLQSECS